MLNSPAHPGLGRSADSARCSNHCQGILSGIPSKKDLSLPARTSAPNATCKAQHVHVKGTPRALGQQRKQLLPPARAVGAPAPPTTAASRDTHMHRFITKEGNTVSGCVTFILCFFILQSCRMGMSGFPFESSSYLCIPFSSIPRGDGEQNFCP